jgi:hypothetical protein
VCSSRGASLISAPQSQPAAGEGRRRDEQARAISKVRRKVLRAGKLTLQHLVARREAPPMNRRVHHLLNRAQESTLWAESFFMWTVFEERIRVGDSLRIDRYATCQKSNRLRVLRVSRALLNSRGVPLLSVSDSCW